jgi:hypothetical protein
MTIFAGLEEVIDGWRVPYEGGAVPREGEGGKLSPEIQPSGGRDPMFMHHTFAENCNTNKTWPEKSRIELYFFLK